MPLFQRNKRARSDDGLLAGINVTPFVDVVLVLLIIFMITAAVVEFGMQIAVPRSAAATPDQPMKTAIVHIGSDGRLFFDGSPVSLYDIGPRAKQANPNEPAVYIQIHKLASYDMVAQVLAECHARGVKINVISKPLEREPRG